MKIDYDFAKEIGATHYSYCDQLFYFYKKDKNDAWYIFQSKYLEWVNLLDWFKQQVSVGEDLRVSRYDLKEIKFPMKTKTTYELVTDLTLKEIAKAMIDGEVFYSYGGGVEYKFEFRNSYGYNFYSSYSENVCAVTGDYYRKVEKPITAKEIFESAIPYVKIATDEEILAACNQVAEQFK